jgi:hypothetical protein
LRWALSQDVQTLLCGGIGSPDPHKNAAALKLCLQKLLLSFSERAPNESAGSSGNGGSPGSERAAPPVATVTPAAQNPASVAAKLMPMVRPVRRPIEI